MFFLCHDSERTEVIEADKSPFGSGKWTSCSSGYDTREELMQDLHVLDKPCACCGNLVDTNYCESTAKVLREWNLCFTCNFWREKIEIANNPNTVRANGSHYQIGPEVDHRAAFKGCGGRGFTIRFKDGREVKTTNLWCQGPIPKRFAWLLRDNAEFVKTPEPIGHGQGFLGDVV